MDPAADKVFLYWIVDQVTELARDPAWMKEFQAWQRDRAAKAAAGDS